MKVYRIIDNSTPQEKIYTDRAELCEALLKVMKKYDDKQSWFYVEEEVI